jgi:acetylornithine deacetylase/succinyl-diaminopimelate desuccinylase-like protein
MTRWRPDEADIEQLLANRDLQLVTGTVADGHPALERAGRTLVSAQTLLDTDPINAFVLAYDAVRQACTALLTHQGLRPTSSGGHVAVERAVRAQFGAPFAPYGGLRRPRNEVEYPSHPDEHVDLEEAAEAIAVAEELIDSAAKLLPHLQVFTT